MSIASQVFLLLYAVMFGAVFTISDRFRPFALPPQSKPGRRRVVLSLLFLGVLPTGYLLFALPILLSVNSTTRGCLGLAIYVVAPLIFSYFSWVWIILWKTDKFYDEEQLTIEPVRSSLEWVGERPLSGWVIGLLTTVLFVVPLVLLMLASSGIVCSDPS